MAVTDNSDIKTGGLNVDVLLDVLDDRLPTLHTDNSDTTNISTSSTIYTTLVSDSITVEDDEAILIVFCHQMSQLEIGREVQVRLRVDGTTIAESGAASVLPLVPPNSGNSVSLSGTVQDLSSGVKTVEIQWRTSATSNVASSFNRTWDFLQFKRRA